MAKNINVKLTFSADTRAAQQQLAQLQQTLSNVAATPATGSGLKATSAEISAATTKALELKVALHNATNVNTGKLNFSKFNQELKKSKTSLRDYAMHLQKLGPQGVQAFNQLAASIRQSEAPVVALQGKMAALGQTMINTVKWQISSSILQGVTSAFSSTIEYAKELNKDLTNIRIVTGKTVEDVSKFAVEANKAAKALSATTSEYAKASLIYFQQGLDGSAVAERTATTLKLAKVVGESAQTTSEWMTAIWNNFDDGSRSLENYADVLAALGAATASSADEIAGGLEKFAAVAETVGLSYEYAASALATITAETRQSEEVVGTALKTIFARVENLKLGETLEDGTSLGQYSEALARVGVHIKDSNDQLKDMDTILDEIGATWGILDRDQQVALAQQVAGIRQYSQFMALMDNWDVMEKNVELSREAAGTLEDQHEIWESGIEGATTRVKEELNEIKNNLLDENDLLPLLNIAEGFLDFVGKLIDSLGGLPGILSIIASVGLKIWGPQAANMLQSMVNGVKNLYGVASGSAAADRSKAIKDSAEVSSEISNNSDIPNQESSRTSEFAKDNAARVIATEEAQGSLNAEYRETLHLLEQIIEKRQEAALAAAKETDAAAEEERAAQEVLEEEGRIEDGENVITGTNGEKISVAQMNQDLERAGQYSTQVESFGSPGQTSAEMQTEADSIVETARKTGSNGDKEQSAAIKKLKDAHSELTRALEEEAKVMKTANKDTEEGRKKIEAAQNKVKNASREFKKAAKEVTVGDNAIKKYSKSTGVSEEKLRGVTQAAEKRAQAAKAEKEAVDKAKQAQDDYNKELDEGKSAGQNWTNTFVNGMQGVASAAAGIQMIQGTIDSLSTAIADGTAGFGDYLSAITSVAFALPMLVQGISSVAKVLKLDVLWKKLAAAASKKLSVENLKEAAAEQAASKKKVAAAITSAMAKIAEWAAKGPAGWIIAGISAALVAGLIGAAIAVNASKKADAKEEEENNTKSIETAEKALEVADGWNTESKAMDDLIDKHKDLQAANDKTIEGQKALKEAQQAIIDQVPKLVEKYKELDAQYDDLDLSGDIALLEGAAANGDVEQIEQITNQMDTKIAQSTVAKTEEGKKGAMRQATTAMSDLQGDVKTEDGQQFYSVHVGGAGSYVEGLIKDSSLSDNGNDIRLDMSDSKEFIKDYEELKAIAKQAEDAGETDDDAYREIRELLDASEEQYNKMKELDEQGKTYEIQNRFNEMGIDLSTIKTYEDYDKVLQQLTSDTEMANIATEEQIKTWLNAQGAVSEFAALEKKADAYGAKYGEAYANSIKDYAKGLNEEDLTAFLKIDFDKFQVQETWDNLIEYTKHLDKAEKLQKDVTAVTNAEKNLKSGGSADDYRKLQESLSWGEDGLIKFSDFLGKTYSQQKAYLEDIKIKKAEAAQEEYKASLEQLKLSRQELQLELEKAILAGDTFRQGQIEADLYNMDLLIEKTESNIELAKIEAKKAKEAQAQRIRDFKNNKKALEDEYDAYRRINELNEDLANTMEDIAAAKDAAYGAEYLSLLDAEISGLEAENKLLDETIKLADKRAASKKKELKNGYGAEFDDFGNISNYNEIQGQYLQDLASLEASQGKDSEAYKIKKQEYDDFKKLAEDYEEDLEKSEQATRDKAANMREILDKKLEGIEYKINIKLEVDDHYLNILQRQLDRLDDDAYDGAARLANYGSQASKVENKKETNMQGIQQVLSTSGVSPEDIEKYLAGDGDVVAKYDISASAMEDLQAYTEGFIEAQSQLEELAESVKGEVMNTFNAWHDKIADVGASIEAQGKLIKSYQNIVDIVGKDKLGVNDSTLKALETANNAAAQASLNNAKAQKEATESALANAKSNKAMYEAGTEEYEHWLAVEEELSKQLEEDTATFMSSWENALTTAYETFASETQRAIENLSDFMAGANFDSMDELSKSFNQQKEASDRYLDNYQKAYELSKLNRKIEQEINKSDNVKAQQVLRDMQEEIAEKQASGVEMSQHDLDILQKKYDLRLAEIALEEAQNTKSQVKLQRNSEGGMSYVYTANESSVEKAEQGYEDKLYALQKSNDDYINNLSQQIINNRKAMEEEIAAIDVTAYASKEEYLAAVSEITTRYQEKENYLMDEMQKTIASNTEIYNEDVLAYGSYAEQHTGVTTALLASNNEYINALSAQVVANRQEMEAAIAAIDESAYATKEEYLAAVQAVTETYQAKEKELLTEIQLTIEANGEVYNGDLAAYAEFVAQREAVDQSWITTFAETPIAMAAGFSSIEEAQTNLNTAIGNAEEGTGLLGELGAAYDTLSTNVDEAMKTAGISMDTTMTEAGESVSGFSKAVNTALYGADGKSGAIGNINDLDGKTKTYEKTAKEKFKNVSDKVTDWYKKYGEKLKAGKKDTDNLEQSIAKLKDKKVTVTTDVKGKDKVDEMTKAIKGIEDAIKKLQNTDFKITANISLNTGGGSGNGSGSGDRKTYTYKVDKASSSKEAIAAGYVRLSDSSGNYVGYVKNNSTALDFNNAGDMANLKDSSEFYKYMVYDVNGGSKPIVAGVRKLSSKRTWGSNWDVESFLAYDGKYSDFWHDDLDMLKAGLQAYGAYIDIGGTRHYGFYNSGKLYFAPLSSFGEGGGWGEHPMIKKDAAYYLAEDFKLFDTGGYTGEWGPEGRVALLHQKEIVLNAHDTENILSVVSMVREMAHQLDLNALAMSQKLGTFNNVPTTALFSGGQLEQSVHITADFPNVTDRYEIAAAFDNLINTAAQYANRKS